MKIFATLVVLLLVLAACGQTAPPYEPAEAETITEITTIESTTITVRVYTDLRDLIAGWQYYELQEDGRVRVSMYWGGGRAGAWAYYENQVGVFVRVEYGEAGVYDAGMGQMQRYRVVQQLIDGEMQTVEYMRERITHD